MTTGELVRTIVGLFVSALLALALGAPALAEDNPTQPGISVGERLALLKESVGAHKRAKDTEGLLTDIRQLIVLHEQANADPKVRKGAVKLLGGLSKRGRLCSSVNVAALDAIGKAKDPDGTRYVTPYLKRACKARTTTAAMRSAVGASMLLCDDKFVEPLLKIVTSSRDMTLAAQAVQALGHFNHCKRKRGKILKTLVDSIAKDEPGAKGRNKDPVPNDQYRHTGDRARNRWYALSRVLPKALLQLTNNETMQGADVHWWIEAVRNNKRNLNALFVDVEEE